MKSYFLKGLSSSLLALTLALHPGQSFGQSPSPATASIIANSNLETDADGDQWPDNWPKAKVGGSWVEENGNHFIRLTSPEPGAMVMIYSEIKIPDGAEALELTWKQRITGLKVGTQAWFDARIMMEFMDAERKKVSPSPGAPNARKDTEGWVEKNARFLVPAGATTLKFMPSLFQVAAGQFDLDDIELKVIDAAALRAQAEASAAEKARKAAEKAQKVRAKADALFQSTGSLISNGDFEQDKNGDQWPDDWGRLKTGGSWELEEGNHFLRMTAPAPDQMTMVYRPVEIPANVQALELNWRQRVTGLKKGKMPWFDARIMLEFKDEEGKKMKEKPSAPYTQKSTDGWVERSKQFLVPEGALTVELMPSLFQVEAGTFDLDQITLKPVSPDALYAAAKEAEEVAKARYVPPEEPNQAKWPQEIKVVGNRLDDPNGKEVWLQGLNAGGLETLPQDTQVIKSVVVGVDEWKANAVRLPVKEEFWFGRSPYQKDGGKEYREKIDQIVTLTANRGAYLVLDLHRFRAPKQEHAEFWTDAAARYKNHPAVLFDLFNEPHDISWEVWRDGGFVGEKKGVDESAFLTAEEKAKNKGFQSVGMQALVNAVRETGARNIVIAGGLAWAGDLSGVAKGYVLDDKGGNGVMYSWHIYNWHKGWEERVMETAKKYPILVGEVGADVKKMDFIPANDQEDPYTWVPDMLGFIQKYKLNWTGWCLHPSATPVMISDWKYTPTPFWGVMAKEAMAGKQFEMKRMR